MRSKNIIIISLAILLVAAGVWGFLEGNARKKAEMLNDELFEKTAGLTSLRDKLSEEVDSLEQAFFTLSEENKVLKGTVEEVNEKAGKAQRALVNERRANAGEINSLRAELEILLNAKREVFKKYFKSFKNNAEVRLLKEPKNCKSNYWLNTIILEKNFLTHQRKIIKLCHNNRIFVRPVWKPLHQLKHFKNFPKMNLNLTNIMAKRVINLPSSSFLN